MAFVRSQTIRHLYRSLEIREISSLIGSSRSYLNHDVKVPVFQYQSVSTSPSYKDQGTFPWIPGTARPVHSTMADELSIFLNGTRLMSTQVKAPPQTRQMGALKVSMLSPGFLYEPYEPRKPIPFWRRWFTRSGWRRTKDDIILEMKSAYAIAKLRKSGYLKQKFYQEAVQLYKEINILMASGDKTSLRKAVTENMYSALKNEIKQRESMWKSVYWELVEPVVKIRTLRARLIGVDRNDLSKVFVQLTLEFLAKQKFEAYDSKGAVVVGDKTKEVLVRDIWVFEKSLFHQGAYWRLCGRIKV
ncbi:Tim44-like domain [Macleaya cordata]|uniref:Large ribosomal subunit protein mL45 n=1 Tax=Macleaya cordata TaxID=56857 RepID=A0A200RBQ5_MACCD|nr:Tim44-like domain [Macleaya cordata]